MKQKKIVVVGAGPAGLMAAQTLADYGYQVEVFERMPTAGRKFLMAGRGGLNLTHSQNIDKFIAAYGPKSNWFADLLTRFSPTDLREWADALGAETFVGSSGRVFPKAMKASPLLRTWLKHLSDMGVRLHLKHTWTGWAEERAVQFDFEGEKRIVQADAVVLALGGASWPKLGSDAKWVSHFDEHQFEPFKPSNMGFKLNWSDHLTEQFAGSALKSVGFAFDGVSQVGEMILSSTGLEGGLIYAFSAPMRDKIDQDGSADFQLDLCPHLSFQQVLDKLEKQPKKISVSNRLRKALGLKGVQIALVQEVKHRDQLVLSEIADLAKLVKNLNFTTSAYHGIERAISSAGGITTSSINDKFMLVDGQGVFVCGEMLDWEAPTGGYLLQGCFSSAVGAANGVRAFLQNS